ncbi:MAG: hypothetical protein KGI02_09145 [Thaumarchaeota archaeon]|nr:hypothetical protein [Nitrososphaerota archaeon]
MKTFHLAKVQYCGLICLMTGLLVLGASFYLFEADLQFYEKIRKIPTSPYPTPIEPSPYYHIQPLFTFVGAVLFCVGFFLLFYRQIKNKIKAQPK